MSSFRNKFAAWTAVAVLGFASLGLASLGATSLFAAQTAAGGGHRHGRFGAFLSSYLNLTDGQQTQAKSIFDDERQSAAPIRQQLQQTRQSLRAAVQANNTAQIQQLATTEGSQVGQLTSIRSAAMAKVYQMLTPDQQQKLAALQQARKASHQAPTAGAQN
jgi:Spy/CpxP family protein refolding chaperone